MGPHAAEQPVNMRRRASVRVASRPIWVGLGLDDAGFGISLLAGAVGFALFKSLIADRLSASDTASAADADPLMTSRLNELTAARDDALRADRAKTDLLSRTSHELRTPLNAILGFAQLLELSPLSSCDLASTHQILIAGRQLLDLVNEALDIAQIESGVSGVTIETVEVEAACRQVTHLLAPLAATRGITLSLCCPTANLVARADRTKLNQVLVNLVSNAIKYNREGGAVEIICAPSADNRVSLTISDTGNGLSAEQIGRLFQPFDRLGAEGSGIEGTGLGLALGRAMAEAMGGQLGVTSEPGRGCDFVIHLPRANDANANYANYANYANAVGDPDQPGAPIPVVDLRLGDAASIRTY